MPNNIVQKSNDSSLLFCVLPVAIVNDTIIKTARLDNLYYYLCRHPKAADVVANQERA